MEQKNRLMIVIAIIVLIAGAMFTSFGRNLFALNTPAVVLPDSTVNEGGTSGDTPNPGANLYQQVEITPETVQNVIRTLSRPHSYYREFSVELFWEDSSSSAPVWIWQHDTWTRVRQILPSGAIRHDLVGDEVRYYWYDGSSNYQTAPVDSLAADLSQRIPTYETVLNLDPKHITDARYEMYNELPCIRVDVLFSAPTRLERYWISVDNGLLVGAETEEDGLLTYRMTTNGIFTSPCPSNAPFSLPDGTVLHSIS